MSIALIDVLNVLEKKLAGPEMHTLTSSVGFPPEIVLNEHFRGFRMDHFKPAGISILSNYGEISQVNLFAQGYLGFETYSGELPRELSMHDSIEQVQDKLGLGAGFGRRYPVGAQTDDPRAYSAHYCLVDHGISYAANVNFGENRLVVQISIVLAKEPTEESASFEEDW